MASVEMTRSGAPEHLLLKKRDSVKVRVEWAWPAKLTLAAANSAILAGQTLTMQPETTLSCQSRWAWKKEGRRRCLDASQSCSSSQQPVLGWRDQDSLIVKNGKSPGLVRDRRGQRSSVASQITIACALSAHGSWKKDVRLCLCVLVLVLYLADTAAKLPRCYCSQS